MSFNFDEEAMPQAFYAEILENKAGLQDTKIPKSIIFRRLLEYLSHGISSDAIEVTERGFSTEFRLHVYVVTPAQLEMLVQRRAERLHKSSPSLSAER